MNDHTLHSVLIHAVVRESVPANKRGKGDNGSNDELHGGRPSIAAPRNDKYRRVQFKAKLPAQIFLDRTPIRAGHDYSGRAPNIQRGKNLEKAQRELAF